MKIWDSVCVCAAGLILIRVCYWPLKLGSFSNGGRLINDVTEIHPTPLFNLAKRAVSPRPCNCFTRSPGPRSHDALIRSTCQCLSDWGCYKLLTFFRFHPCPKWWKTRARKWKNYLSKLYSAKQKRTVNQQIFPKNWLESSRKLFAEPFNVSATFWMTTLRTRLIGNDEFTIFEKIWSENGTVWKISLMDFSGRRNRRRRKHPEGKCYELTLTHEDI